MKEQHFDLQTLLESLWAALLSYGAKLRQNTFLRHPKIICQVFSGLNVTLKIITYSICIQ